MKKIKILLLLAFCVETCFSQQMDISLGYGRFWAPYKHVDYGTGFRNLRRSNYNFFPSFTLNKYYKDRFSMELGIFFTLYEQYYSTRKYFPAFESSYGAGHVSLRPAYSIIKRKCLEMRVKGGVSIGIAPDMFESEYREMFVYPYVDSITRGTIKRNFTPIFPMLTTGIDISYRISKRFAISATGNYQKGFLKITEYDVYYNDGSGFNDQRAKQWGTGDFYGFQLGVRYAIRDENGNKFKRIK